MHKLRLHEKYFNLINSGEKTIELRLSDEKRKLIHIEDEIEFSQIKDPNQKCFKKVKALYRAQDFEQICEQIDIAKTGFKTAEELICVLSKFRYILFFIWYIYTDSLLLIGHILPLFPLERFTTSANPRH